jgi:hypothetical protein
MIRPDEDPRRTTLSRVWRVDRRARPYFLSLLIAVVLTGCQTIGPGAVERDRLDYASALAESWKQQMLLNIVKLRYLDTPIYLDVSSVVSSYSLSREVNISANIVPRTPDSNSGSLGASGSYSESPTISYAPLTGERLVNSLLRPLPPETIFTMIGAGHPADFLLRATVRAINGVYNASTSPARARRGDPKFTRVIEAIHRIEQAGALNVRIEKRDGQAVTFIAFQRNVNEDVERDIRLVKELLALDPGIDEFRLIAGPAPHRPNEIALLTRSMQELMSELAAGVDVPKAHQREERATPSPKTDTGAAAELVHILSSTESPKDAFASVHYRDYWFWIDDRDLRSKRVFMFLMMFSSLAESGALPQAPVLTIPTR